MAGRHCSCRCPWHRSCVALLWAAQLRGPWFHHLWRRWPRDPCVCARAQTRTSVCAGCACGMCVLSGAVARPQLGLGRAPSPASAVCPPHAQMSAGDCGKKTRLSLFTFFCLLNLQITNSQSDSTNRTGYQGPCLAAGLSTLLEARR